MQQLIESEITDDSGHSDILTLKNIFYFIKRAALRTVLYLAAVLIVTFVIFTGIYSFTKNRGKAVALIQYNYPGAESGLDPFGQVLNVNLIKSEYIAEKALNDTGYAEKASGISHAINITPVVPDYILKKYYTINKLAESDPLNLSLLKELEFYPVQFSVELEMPALKSGEAKEILNRILSEYTAYFTSMFYALNVFDGGSLSLCALEKYDYTDISELYEIRLTQFNDYLTGLLKNNKDYKSGATGLSLNELKTRTEIMRSYDLRLISEFISLNSLTKYNYGEYRKQKNEKIKLLEADKAVLEAAVQSLKAVLADYEKTSMIILPSTGDGKPVEVLAPSDHYESLLNELIRTETEIAKISEKIKLISLSLEKIAGQATDSKSAANETELIETLLKNLNAEFNDLTQTATKTINEFYEKEYMASAVRAAIPPVGFIKRLSDMHAPFIFAVAALIALTVALTETGIRINYEKKRSGSLPKAALT